MKPKFKVGDLCKQRNINYFRKIIKIDDNGYHYNFGHTRETLKSNNVDSIRGFEERFEIDREWLWNKQLKELLK